MAIPLSYNLRNLRERKTHTIMTALGLALTVAVALSVLALVDGLRQTFRASGDPLNILVLRKGATTELASNFNRSVYNDLKFKPGIARTPSGEPMASLELVTVIGLESPEHPEGTNVNFRGLKPIGIRMRKDLEIVAGRWFRPGFREAVVGQSVAARYPEMGVGGKLHLGHGDWDVVGVMRAGESSINSEIFCDLDQVAADENRPEVLSSTLLQAADAVSKAALIRDLSDDQRLNVDAVGEVEYYDRQTRSSAPVEFVGLFVAALMSIGSSFAAMNTMYAAVSHRAREIGTLRVLGFSKGAILLSFLLESLALAALGGIIGCLLVLPLNNLTSAIGSFTTFSETTFHFRVTPQIMGIGMLFAGFMGTLGGLFPASNAARKEILVALRSF
ncbi:MAG TPA: ABC transporter permease [Bryobacteraceae bacterium]|nr:ABC transporter permease [Bryobacteraceae bacterium]